MAAVDVSNAARMKRRVYSVGSKFPRPNDKKVKLYQTSPVNNPIDCTCSVISFGRLHLHSSVFTPLPQDDFGEAER